MTTFDNPIHAEAHTGFPANKLKLARKVVGLSKEQGMMAGTRINWDKFQAWYNVPGNKASLDALYDKEYGNGESTGDNRSNEQIRRSILLQEEEENALDIKKKSGQYLDPKEVKEFLLSIGSAQSSIMKRWVGELPPRLVGKGLGEIEAELNKAVGEVFITFKTELSKWLSQSKQNS